MGPDSYPFFIISELDCQKKLFERKKIVAVNLPGRIQFTKKQGQTVHKLQIYIYIHLLLVCVMNA